MIRRLAILPALLLAAGVQARPVTIHVGSQQAPSVLYGPADMLCDLNTCRLFNLPEAVGLPPNAIVEFGLPQLNGQNRVDIRRCLQLCRASVLGAELRRTTPPDHANPTVTIAPIEMRLE